MLTRRRRDLATDTPAAVPTAVSPAAPASHGALTFGRAAAQSPYRSTTLARRSTICSGDPAAGTGDNLVVDGAEEIGPILRRGLALRAGAEQNGVVTLGHVDLTGTEVHHELVHADSTDAASRPAVDQHVDAAAQGPEHTVGITDRQQRQRGVALGDPGVTIGHSVAGPAPTG